MGFNPQEGLAKSHKTGNVEDRVRCELVKLHTVNIKEPMKELVGRKRESAEKEREENHPVAARGLGDPFGGREDDGVIVRDETVCLGLGLILLLKAEGTQLIAEFVALPLAILFFFAKCFTRIHNLRSGARQENSREQRLN
jgi:hypothetical protein